VKNCFAAATERDTLQAVLLSLRWVRLMTDDDQVLRALKVRARRVIHIAFSALALFCLSAAVLLHHAGASIAVPPPDVKEVANAFLCLGAGHAVTMFVWDWLFWDEPAE
jgi:hypothetical protein